MTVAAQNTETVYNLIAANLGPFASGWTCEDLSQVHVWLDVGAGPALLGAGLYTVAGSSPLTAGLSVTLNGANLPAGGSWAAGSRVILQRVTPSTQPAALGEAVGFSPSAYEAALDHLQRQIQELQTALMRVIAGFPGDVMTALPAAEIRETGYLIFDSLGNPQITGAAGGGGSTAMPVIAAGTVLGNASAGAAAAAALSAAQATSILNAMAGDTGAGGTKGLAPAPAAGDAAANKYLKADGTWEPAGYINVPVDPTAGAYALVAADAGRTKYFAASAAVTIPSGLPVGDPFDLVFAAGATGTITPAGGVTLLWPSGALTGARTVTGPGTITIHQVAANIYWVRGGYNVT